MSIGEVSMLESSNQVFSSSDLPKNDENLPESKDLRKYDLVPLMSTYWDTQMLLPVLYWLEERKIYSLEVISPIREVVLSHCMLSEEKKAESVKTAADLEYYLQSYFAALIAYKKDQQNRMGAIADKKSMQELSDWCLKSKFTKDIKEESLPFPNGMNDKLLYLAKTYFAMGDYKSAKRHQDFYTTHVIEFTTEGNDFSKQLSCYWGMVASVILHYCSFSIRGGNLMNQNILEYAAGGSGDDFAADNLKVEEGVQNLLKLVELIDNWSLKGSRGSLLLQRSWIVHWAIWPIFRYYLPILFSDISNQSVVSSTCWVSLIDTLFAEKNTVVVQLICPHMLRYYCAYLILNRKRKDYFQTVLQLISTTKSKYSDSFTLLLEALYVDFNFEAAQGHMADISAICTVDFFLEPLKAAIEEHSRLLIFEIYCRIHRSINLDMIANKLNLSSEMAQRWIVNLIRTEKLEAKIDSEKNRLEIAAVVPNVYQQIIDRTHMLANRSNITYQSFCNYMIGKYEIEAKEGRGGKNRLGRGGRMGNVGDEDDGNTGKGGHINRLNIGQGNTYRGLHTHTGNKEIGDDAFWE